ncbi:LOW QUALITY PROTEIN: membrane-spanning 4-domains subfamily A member 12 [Prionailurus bengalensis]|uniref:LOW QUALITY PROTEIN: membrane-spanning 4-domains subfamily A member 12 n=1 Tax=Prionailurus bengalensis TaxID=37029 RepID=UPI001CA8A73C|nr:LOW QUALITY PROTEIN: membrane-spanning 4-domains subfamily A member 12 [Prionailurus bengalensis]
MSSQPTNQPQTYETTLSPYPPSNTMAPGSPPPLGFTHPTKQAQSAQPPFFGSPGIITKSQQGQGNIQMVNPATGAATTNFREEAKILGAIQILIGLMHIGFRIILGLMDAIYGLVFAFLSFAFISGYAIRIRGSLGMNTVSAIFVSTGVTLLLLDAGMNGILSQDCWAILAGKRISALLIMFSVLEFCTNCTPVLVIPNVYATSTLAPESSSAPPRDDGHLAYAI